MTERMRGNINTGTKVLLIGLQLALAVMGWTLKTTLGDIRDLVRMHETRIDKLESFAAAGDRWALQDQRGFESELRVELSEQFSEINGSLTEIKVALAKSSANERRLDALEKLAHTHGKP